MKLLMLGSANRSKWVRYQEKPGKIFRSCLYFAAFLLDNFSILAQIPDRCGEIAIKSFITVQEMKERIRQREVSARLTPDAVEAMTENRSVGGTSVLDLTNTQLNYDYAESLNRDPKSKWIEIREYFSVPENKYSMVAPKGVVVLRDGPMPWGHRSYPVLATADTPDPEVFWGKSTAENIVFHQAELNAVRNSWMDRQNFALNPMFTVKNGANIPTKDLVSYPGGKITVRDQDDIKRLDMGPTLADEDIRREDIIKRDAQTVAGVTDFSVGNPYTSTATGASMMNSQQKGSLTAKVAAFDETCLRPMAKHFLALNAQFTDDAKEFYAGGISYRLLPVDFSRDYDFMGLSEVGSWNKQVRQNSFMQFQSFAKGNPHIDQVELAKLGAAVYGMDARVVISANPMPTGIPQGGNGQALMAPNPNAPQLAQPDAGIMSGTPRDFVQGAAQ